MANVPITPNPNGCTISCSGGGSGEIEEGSTLSLTCTRKNYHVDDTPMPHWEILYGGGADPSVLTCSVTVGNDNIKKICGFLSTTSPLDGSQATGGVNITLHGLLQNDTIDNNAEYNMNLSGSYIRTTTDSEGESHSQSGDVTGLRKDAIGWFPAGPKVEGDFDANFPIFMTMAEADTWLLTGEGTPLNVMTPIEPNTYDYYIYNMITSTLGSGTDFENYERYATVTNGRLAYYLKTDGMFDRALTGVENITDVYKGDSPEEDPMPLATVPFTKALGAAVKYDNGDKYYPLMYQTNIPTFDTKAHADNYILTGDETGIIDKWRTDDVQPGEIGDPTDQTEQGENGAVFSYGGGMFRLTNAQLASFYAEAFNTDPNVMQSILDGLQLFGSNQINSIHDVMYIPFAAEDVATLSSGNDIYLGSYKMTTLTGDRVLKNDKLINMGTHYFAPPYGAGDHRNYAPLCRIFVMLPYAGTHELQIDKYIGKNITLKLAVDLTTGAGTYFIFSNQTIMDSFDCQIGAHRPLTAVDHAQHVAAVTNAILQTGTQGIKTVAGATNAINPAQAATASREATKTSLNAAGLGGVVGGAIGTVVSGYQGMQSTIDYPMTERGSFNGFLGMFDVKSPYFVFCQMQTKQAENLIRVKGKPSAAGGKLSSFFGYFEAAAVDLPSFSGTEAEAEELMSILKGGIYID